MCSVAPGGRNGRLCYSTLSLEAFEEMDRLLKEEDGDKAVDWTLWNY